MYVYRVHHRDNFKLGPYTYRSAMSGGVLAKCWSRKYVHKYSYDFTTAPANDFGGCYWYNEHLLFGFHSLGALYDWFNIRELMVLISDGFKVSRVEAELVIISSSNRQCVFKPKE